MTEHDVRWCNCNMCRLERTMSGFYWELGPDGFRAIARRIEARSDETPQAARPEGREPDGEAGAPSPSDLNDEARRHVQTKGS